MDNNINNESCLVKLEGYEDLYKDKSSNGVINNNVDAFRQFKSKKKKEKQLEERLSRIEKSIERLEKLILSKS